MGQIQTHRVFSRSDLIESHIINAQRGQVPQVRDHLSITSAKRWVGGGGQTLMFADKVGGWVWPNADVSKK